MKHTHQTHRTQQGRELQAGRQKTPVRSPQAPQLGTSVEQVTRARARTMQGAISEFAKLMDELNQSREKENVYDRDPSLML